MDVFRFSLISLLLTVSFSLYLAGLIGHPLRKLAIGAEVFRLTKGRKVEIPDIFDNTVPGFKLNDFLRHTLPNPNYEDTNLFNLTYFITDKDGTNILTYSLDEVIIKLQGLKYWLKKNQSLR
jgi:hypothetical protein